jgi:hypothetical protein
MNGDDHFKIDHEKIMFSICDGIGDVEACERLGIHIGIKKE